MIERKDRRYGSLGIANTDHAGPDLQGGERAVEVAATVTQAIAPFVKSHHRGEGDVGHERLAFLRHRNVPEAPNQRITRFPAVKDQRPVPLGDNRQGAARTAFYERIRPPSQIGFPPQRPMS
jgi:hypothetical protein